MVSIDLHKHKQTTTFYASVQGTFTYNDHFQADTTLW